MIAVCAACGLPQLNCSCEGLFEPRRDIEQYVIYDHPLDFPNSCVVRRWVIPEAAPGAHAVVRPDALPFIVGPSLDACRWLLNHRVPGLTNLGRQLRDDPCIAETWM